jgi:hypothetical protein
MFPVYEHPRLPVLENKSHAKTVALSSRQPIQDPADRNVLFFYDIALPERAASHFSTGIACRLNFIGAKSPCFAGGRGVKYPMQAQQRNDALSRD